MDGWMDRSINIYIVYIHSLSLPLNLPCCVLKALLSKAISAAANHVVARANTPRRPRPHALWAWGEASTVTTTNHAHHNQQPPLG